MPQPRYRAEPPARTTDPRLSRSRSTTASRDVKSEDASSAASVSSAAGPHRPPAGLDRAARTSGTPYSKSRSSKPPVSRLPASIFAQDGSGLVFCGSCQRFQHPRTFADRQLSTARRSLDSARRDRRDLKLRDFPKCLECIAPQATTLKCAVCGFVRPASFFSEAMRANTRGATCRNCQSRATDDKDVKPRAVIEADPFADLSSDEDLDPYDLAADELASGGGSARGGVAGQALAVVGRKVPLEGSTAGLDEAYGVRGGEGAHEEPVCALEGGEEEEEEKVRTTQPAVVYDEDDDDW